MQTRKTLPINKYSTCDLHNTSDALPGIEVSLPLHQKKKNVAPNCNFGQVTNQNLPNTTCDHPASLNTTKKKLCSSVHSCRKIPSKCLLSLFQEIRNTCLAMTRQAPTTLAFVFNLFCSSGSQEPNFSFLRFVNDFLVLSQQVALGLDSELSLIV